jgi:hypothetical protein
VHQYLELALFMAVAAVILPSLALSKQLKIIMLQRGVKFK